MGDGRKTGIEGNWRKGRIEGRWQGLWDWVGVEKGRDSE